MCTQGYIIYTRSPFYFVIFSYISTFIHIFYPNAIINILEDRQTNYIETNLKSRQYTYTFFGHFWTALNGFKRIKKLTFSYTHTSNHQIYNFERNNKREENDFSLNENCRCLHQITITSLYCA